MPDINLSRTFCAVATCLITAVFANAVEQTPNTAIQRIDAWLNANVEGGVSAAILIASQDEILLSKGYGFANRSKDELNTPNTVFDIGSLTKQFTAAAVLKLAENGSLQLDDQLSKFFKDIPVDKQKITLHQLLTHSAGFVEYPASDFDPVSTGDYIRHALDSPLEFEPGTRYSYSNVGYGLLGILIERVSGSSYEHYLRDTFFKPLKMERTGYLSPKWNQSDLAHGYVLDFYDWGTSVERYREGGVSPVLIGNGGVNSTIGDLYRWMRALASFRVLTKASVELLMTPHIARPDPGREYGNTSFYAYGWSVGRSRQDTPLIVHSGNNGSFRSTVMWLPKEEATIIYLSNNGFEGSFQIPFIIEMMLFDSDFLPPVLEMSAYRIIDDYVNTQPPTQSRHLVEYFVNKNGQNLDDKSVLNRLSLLYIDENRNIEWAVELLKLNVAMFPKDGNLWDSLGGGYLAANMPEQALQSFKKAIGLAPAEGCHWCENSAERITELEGDDRE